MASPAHAKLSTPADSPYAAELQRGDANLRFSPALESEYVRNHLLNNRTLIRMACLLAVLVAVFRAADNTLSGSWAIAADTGLVLTIFGLIMSGSLALAWIAWSPAFERLYLPVARIVVPIRNFIAAAPIAAMAAQGQLELLMFLPLLVLGPFFFLGLQFRAALVSVVLTVTSFATSALFFALPLPVLLRSCIFLLLTVAACAIAARELERWSRKSFLESRLIAELAQHDALTGTKNRRVFDEHLVRLWRQAADDQRTLAIALIDVDHFKAYNDRYGHQAGDHTLRRVAQTLQTFVCRPLDVLARYGGEEFAVILYDTEESQAIEIADRMRRAVSKLAIEHRGSQTCATVTVSIGVAIIKPSDERKSRGALQLADEALYQAKVGGRNRIELKGGAEYDALVTGVFSKSPFAAPQPSNLQELPLTSASAARS